MGWFPEILAGSLIRLALCAVASCAVVPTAMSAQKRVALVIGNAGYETLSSLANPTNDARRMADLLVTHGFDVLSCDGRVPGCFDLGRAEMLDALDEFRAMSREADVALAFYAGHGMQTANGNVLAPTDIVVDCGDWTARREVLLDDVMDAMAGAKDRIVILDACRNDPFKAQQCLARGVRPLSFGTFAVPESSSRFLLMSSTQNGQLAQDGLPGGHSPFAESLFESMERGASVSFDQMLNRAARRVIQVTAARNFTQVPEMLVRGGAPEICLSATDCGQDPQAVALARELEALREKASRNQEYESIVTAILRSGGRDPNTIGVEEKERFFINVLAATRALASENSEPVMAALRNGDSSAAMQEIGARLEVLRADPEAEPLKVAELARHLAAFHTPMGDFAAARELYAEAARNDPANLRNWIDLAETLMTLGDRAGAKRAYEEGRVRGTRALPPDKVWVVEGLADCFYYDRDLETAGRLYDEANRLAAALLADNPGNRGLRRGLIVTHYNLGHVAMDADDLPGALGSFRTGLRIAEELTREDPADLRWQFDIGRGHERVGRALLASGDRAGALQSFLRKQVIAERLARSGESTYVSDAALADEFLAEIARGDGDLAMAELRYGASLDRMIALREAAPANPAYRRFTAVTHMSRGDVRLESDDPEGAFADFLEAARLLEPIALATAGDPQWSWDLFLVYQRLASTRPPGTEYHRKALATIETLAAQGQLAPDNERWIDITRQRLAAAETQARESAE